MIMAYDSVEESFYLLMRFLDLLGLWSLRFSRTKGDGWLVGAVLLLSGDVIPWAV